MNFDLQLFKASGHNPFRGVPSRMPLPPPSFKRFGLCESCGLKITTPHEIQQHLCDECFEREFPPSPDTLLLDEDLEQIVQDAIDNA